MIEKSVGFLRNLYKKRKSLLNNVVTIVKADDLIIIANINNEYTVTGHTEDDARTVHMLGTAIGSGFRSAKSNDPDLTVDNYLHQPTVVAFNYIERNGLL